MLTKITVIHWVQRPKPPIQGPSLYWEATINLKPENFLKTPTSLGLPKLLQLLGQVLNFKNYQTPPYARSPTLPPSQQNLQSSLHIGFKFHTIVSYNCPFFAKNLYNILEHNIPYKPDRVCESLEFPVTICWRRRCETPGSRSWHWLVSSRSPPQERAARPPGKHNR